MPCVRQKGFTLIEVIVSIVIIGILGASMGTGIARIIQGYLFSRDNGDTSMQCQIAFSRMVKELRAVDGVSSGTGTSIDYSYNRDGNSVSGRILSWTGSATDPLVLGGNPLVDKVSDFELTYHTGFNDPGDNIWNGTETMIGITLKLKNSSDQVSSFSTRVVPRNL